MRHFPKLRLGLTIIALLVLIASGFRYTFFLTNAPDYELTTSNLLVPFYTGLKFDTRMAILLVVPFFAMAQIRTLDPARNPAARTFRAAHFTVVTLIVVGIFLADLGHYGYLQARLDASAFRFMENPPISLRMVWETYSILPILLVLVIFGSVEFLAIRWLLSLQPLTLNGPNRSFRIAVVTSATIFFLAGIYGKFSYYPLRWSDAYASTTTFSADLT